MPTVERIFVYPIKSLDGVSVGSARIGVGGALAGDREFAFFDDSGDFVNARRYPQIIKLRARYELGARQVSLHVGGPTMYSLDEDKYHIARLVSQFVGTRVGLEANPAGGFPDETEMGGPTIIARETLAEMSRWFPGLSPAQLLLRLRPSILISGVPPFWEDQLVGSADVPVSFSLGDVRLEGAGYVARTKVATRDPMTAAEYPRFQRIFEARREQFLPAWAERSRFDHFYRVAVHTTIPGSEIGKAIHVGDKVTLAERTTA